MIKILVIDDEKELCQLFQKALTIEGYEVVTALDGLKGIEEFKKSHPDMIFLDLKMPKMDGVETLKRIREIDKKVIVIMLTGHPSMDTALTGYYLNIYEYMTKPFSLDKISAVIKRALVKHKVDPAPARNTRARVKG